MKAIKTIILLSLALFLITALVSCGGAEGPVGPVDPPEKTIDVIVPWNSTDTDTGAKGLTGMVTDLFNTQPGVNPASMTVEQREIFQRDNSYAQVVMTCQPIFPTFKTISGVKLTATTSQLDLGFTMYGYTIVPDNLKSSINKDGIYVLYKIYEGENHIGYFEYYYNALTSRVTYRQYVMLTINAYQNATGYYMNNAVLLFCLEDVPVKIELDGSVTLSANQWDSKNNKLETKQCFADFFFTGDHNSTGQQMGTVNPRFERRVFTLKSSKGVTVSFCQPWASGKTSYMGITWETDDYLLNSINTIMDNTFGTSSADNIIDQSTKDKFTGDTAVEIIKVLYPNAEDSVIKGGWTKYEDFKAKSLYDNKVTGDYTNDDLKGSYHIYTEVDNVWLSYFDLDRSLTKRAFYDTSLLTLNPESYENYGFKSLLGVGGANDPADAKSKVLNNFIPLCMNNTDSTVISSVVSQFTPYI